MSASRRSATFATLLVTVASLVLASGAPGAGGPITGYTDPSDGIGDRAGEFHYFAMPRSGKTTVLELDTASDRFVRTGTLDGNLGIPGVAMDGTPGGLSADGSTLVVAEPGAALRQDGTSRFDVIRTERLGREHPIELEGAFAFDAISPDGDTIYLIEYPSSNPTKYVVRAYDRDADKLERKPVVDPDEEPGEMRGFPLTRVTGADGDWEFTLYDGGGETPFVHALNTATRTAVCIDLDSLEGFRRIYNLDLTLSSDGSRIAVDDVEGRGRQGKEASRTQVASIDTEALTATAYPPPDESAGP